MAGPVIETDKSADGRIILGLLESVERDGRRSQRQLAAEFGVALGLINSYLKRCVAKGLVKVKEAPARRYTYYLTPQGFAEKSRLTIEYISVSFSFFRRARADCGEILAEAKRRGWSRIVLLGMSDLAEIAAICSLESDVRIVAVVDAAATQPRFIGAPVFPAFEAVPESFDAVVITDLKAAQAGFDNAARRFGANRVFVPALLGVARISADAEAAVP